MKVQFSGIGMTDGRGKINGSVASKNRSGAYVRVKVSGVNPQTTFQLAVRNRLTSLSQAWRSLLESQRQAWNGAVQDFARTDVFGNLRNPTGKNLYTRLNANLIAVGEAAIDDAPVPSGGGPAVVGAVVITNGGVKTVAHNVTDVRHALQVWATPGVSPGKSFLKGQYRLLQVIPAAGTSPTSIAAAYTARFGEPAVDLKVGIRLVSVHIGTGESGTPSEATTLVV